MKLVMTLVVRNETDIIKQNIIFHKAQGVDFFIVLDNGSTDKTDAILKDFERQGILKYYYEPAGAWTQSEFVTKLAREAYMDFGAAWVINNDADEFWLPTVPKRTLKETFESLENNINIVVAKRLNMVALCQNSSKSFNKRMVYKDLESKNPIGDELPPKVVHRGSDSIVVGGGNHQVHGFSDRGELHDTIEILHYPVRSREQHERKMMQSGKGHKLAGRQNLRYDLYMKYLEDKDYYNERFSKECYTFFELLKARLFGRIVKDTRVLEILKQSGESVV